MRVNVRTGQTWVLRPTSPPSKGACMLGRSTGKRFKESGISMSKDSSVSTTHAKITVSGGRLYFADAGSTNGSTVNGINVGKEGAPVELSTGMVLGVGETLLKVTLVSV
ncbi:SMAD/FHA domain-containing protein [Tribonema minus]|uniref:SMAD/FHA domain-containing protein n=1 Tax=Tribonema minus TaxID=303371 RepID=A0A836CG29_9STRA|nr:SMAD/FHA domain-containing protein [Tribonema minus]